MIDVCRRTMSTRRLNLYVNVYLFQYLIRFCIFRSCIFHSCIIDSPFSGPVLTSFVLFGPPFFRSYIFSQPTCGSSDECRGAPSSCRPSDQPTWAVSPPVGCRPYIHHRHNYYYYSARKLILILPSHGGWKVEST